MNREFDAYSFVGREDLRDLVAHAPSGLPITAREILEGWLARNGSGVATFVVDLEGVLRVAPRQSEHVVCAAGAEVLAAGEIQFGSTLTVAYSSNQSAGYCPDISCWNAVAFALERAGLRSPSGFTAPIIWRRCLRCDERSLVKESWFVCAFCDADLPREWNAGRRRRVSVRA